MKSFFATKDNVSIPSNRVLPSVTEDVCSAIMDVLGLNPLKSGPTFGLNEMIKAIEKGFEVSIPSNRVLPSV